MPYTAKDIIKVILEHQNFIYFSYMLKLFKRMHLIDYSNKKEKHREYVKLWRECRRLEKDGFIKIQKDKNGLIFVACTTTLIDLITQARNSNFVKKPSNSIYNLPARARPERIEAIKTALSCKMLNAKTREEIQELFELYLEEIDEKIIVLLKNPYGFSFDEKLKVLSYKTRFNDKAIAGRNLSNYEKLWELATLRYKKGIHLTLTTDPKMHESLWHSWRHFQKALNRFFSYVRKLLGYRPPYVAVYEFTKSGLLHAHIIMFGTGGLMPKRKITRLWEKHGQGKVNYIYTIKNARGRWIYYRKKPKDLKNGQTADAYLKKYLKKALFEAEGMALYWTANKRFFTCSRLFSEVFHKKVKSTAFFIFLGVFNKSELERLLTDYILDRLIEKAIHRFENYIPA